MDTKDRFSLFGASVAVIAMLGPVVSADAFAGGAQRKGGGGGGGGGRSSTPPVSHARRDQVRTPTARPQQQAPQQRMPQQRIAQPPQNQGQPPRTGNNRPQGGGQPQNTGRPTTNGQPRVRLPRVMNTPQRQNERKFTKTGNGRRYDNGLQLHKGHPPTFGWQKPYFPHGTVHFPYYASSYSKGHTFISPWGFFFGVCPPFIDPGHCHVYPPSFVFIDIPIFNGTACLGFPVSSDDNWFDHSDLQTDQPGLVNAISELSETFENGDIDALATLISPNVSVAIYERGKYRYSLDSADFVDLTRDAIQNNRVSKFDLSLLHQRQPGVFCVSGSEMYTDPTGATRTVWVSYVLQDFSGQWTLTQVGTSPDHTQAW